MLLINNTCITSKSRTQCNRQRFIQENTDKTRRQYRMMKVTEETNDRPIRHFQTSALAK